MAEQQSYNALATLLTGTSEANQLDFIVRRILSGMATTSLVKVMAVSGSGLAATGTVDVQILVSQMDGAGNAIDHGTIYGVPYFRLMGGVNAVIVDPRVGDIGVCVFCSRDISSAKVNKEPSVPPSRRKYSYSDGLYFGTFLSETPENYIQFDADGNVIIKPASKVSVIGDLEIDGNVTTTGTIDADGDISSDGDVTADGISLKTHKHGGVTTGGGTSGPPQ